MNSTLDLISQYLDHEEWDYTVEEHPGHTYLLSSFTGSSTRLDVVFDTLPEPDTVLCFAYLPVVVPDSHRGAAAELAARINYRLAIGCFDFDPDDGVLRVRNALTLDGVALTPELLRGLRDTAISTADYYNPAFMRLIYGQLSAREALEELLAQSGEEKVVPAGRMLQ